MEKISKCIFLVLPLVCAVSAFGQVGFEKDTFPTASGPLEITFIGHGTLMFTWKGRVIHVDPVGQYADYSQLPKADLILITHEHGDHLDARAIQAIEKAGTQILLNPASFTKLGKGTAIKNGEGFEYEGMKILAVPAYNTTEGRDRFHPKGRDNGYVLQFPGLTIYVAGDTEDIPELQDLKGIDVAFLPMNQPYTMTPTQVARSAQILKPKVLYPYHFGDTPTEELIKLMKATPAVEVRIRKMK